MSAYSDAVLADTPVGYWRLGESSGDCADSSGNGYTAVAHGTGPTYSTAGALSASGDTTTAVTGTYNQNCLVTTETGASLNFGTGDFTVEAWLKLGASGTNAFAAVYKGGESGVSGWRLGIDTADKVKILVGDTSSYREGNVSNALTVTNWNHIVVTYDRSGVATGYVNGSATGVTYDISARSGSVDSSVGLHIGWVNVSGKTVAVDEVAVYTGLLSSTRIAAHYTAGTTSSFAGPWYYKDTYSLSELTGGLT